MQGGRMPGNQAPAGAFGAGNPFGDIIEQMMRAGGMAPKPEPQSAPDPFDNPFGKVLKDMEHDRHILVEGRTVLLIGVTPRNSRRTVRA